MCGRFTNRLSWSDLVRIYRITETGLALNLPPRFNIAPTQPIPAVRLGSKRARELVLLRWGLIPAWAKEIGAPLINARAESVADKASFRDAFQKRRCLIPADGFYEWQLRAGRKQPYLIGIKGGTPFTFAGLWETWTNPADRKPIESCTIVTTVANEVLRPIHERMPAILDPADHEAWLDVDATPAVRAREMLRPFPGNAMAATAVSPRVNSVANDDAECVAPLTEESPPLPDKQPKRTKKEPPAMYDLFQRRKP